MSRFLLNPARTVIVLMTVYGLMILNWLAGSLRFTSPRLNVLSLVAALCLPVVCPIILVLAPRRNAWRIASAVGLTILAGLSIYVAANCLSAGGHEIVTNQDSDFSLLQTVPVAGAPTRIYAYRGFMDDYETIVIRQEFSVLPGLIWIHELHEEYADRIVKVEILDKHLFRCAIIGYPHDGGSATKHTVVLTAR